MRSSARAPDPRVERSRARVLDAVASLLVEQGIQEITVDAVMARSGVARATVYRHWPTRQALVLAGLRHLLPPPAPRPEAREGTLARQLTSYLVGLTRQLAVEPWVPAMPALLDAARREPEVARATARFAAERQAPLRAMIGEAVEDGSLAAVDIEAALAQLLGPLLYRRLITPEPLGEDSCAAIVEDFLRARVAH